MVLQDGATKITTYPVMGGKMAIVRWIAGENPQ